MSMKLKKDNPLAFMYVFCSLRSVKTYSGLDNIHSFELDMTTNSKRMKFGKQSLDSNGCIGVNDTILQEIELPNKG